MLKRININNYCNLDIQQLLFQINIFNLATSSPSKYIHSSLSVWYLKEGIKRYAPEFEVEVYESTVNRDISKTLSEILQSGAKTVAFACYIWNIEYVKKLINLIYENNPEISVMLGGPEATFDAENLFYISPAVKYIIRGEGEEVLPALLKGEIKKGVCYENAAEYFGF